MPEAESTNVAPVTPPAPPRRYEIPAFADQVADAGKQEPEKPEKSEKPEVAESDPKVAQDSGEQAPPAESEGEKPKEELTPEQAAKRDGRRFERKLDKAYRQRAEAQARAELLEKRLKEIEERSKPPEPEGAPTLEQFEYDPEKYANAKAEFAKKQAAKELTAKQQAEQAEQARKRLISGWEQKYEKGEEKYDDYATVVGQIQPDSAFAAAIMEADNGEEIAYYLGKNIKEANRIAALSPLSQVREIGKIEAKLLAKPAEPKTPSKAPAPITPLSGAAQVATDVPSENDDMKTWIRKRQKQLGRK